MLSVLYFIFGFTLIMQFTKLFANFSVFDLVIMAIFIIERRAIKQLFEIPNLYLMFKIIFVLLTASFTFASISNPQAMDNLNYYLQYMFCIFVGLPVFALTFRTEKINSVCFGIGLGSVFASAILILYRYNDLPAMVVNFFEISVTGGVFYRIGLIGVNDFAIIIASCILYILVSEQKSIFKMCLLVVLLYLAINTGSRIGFVIIFVTLLLYLPMKILISLAAVFSILLSLVLNPLAWFGDSNPLLRLVQLGLHDQQRALMISNVLKSLNEDLFGVGLGEYVDPITGYAVHNFFLLNLVEQGFFAGFVFILVPVFIAFYSILNTTHMYQKGAIFFHLAGLAVITHGFDRFFWIIFAIGLHPNIKKNEELRMVRRNLKTYQRKNLEE